MSRGILALAALAAAAAAFAATGSPSSKDEGRQLFGTFGPGLTIHVRSVDAATEPDVESLRPGTYWLTVHDTSASHNFHITGPGIDEIVTGVAFKGDVTVKLHLEHGHYAYQCDPHALLGMKGAFDVGGVGQVG